MVSTNNYVTLPSGGTFSSSASYNSTMISSSFATFTPAHCLFCGKEIEFSIPSEHIGYVCAECYAHYKTISR